MAHAQVLTWDGNGSIASNPAGGNGTWNTSLLNWWNGTSNIAWPTAGTNNDAVFANTAGTVTISGGVIANDLTFSTANYSLTSGTLTLNGSTPTITASAAATINSALAGTAGLTKAGTGNLTLTGSNSGLSGALLVNAGRVIINSANAFGGYTSGTIQSGGSLQLMGGVTTGSSVAFTLFGTGAEGALFGDSAVVNGAVTIGDASVRIGTSTGATASSPGLTVNGAITAPVGSGRGLMMRFGLGAGLTITNTANYWEGITFVAQGVMYAAPNALPLATNLSIAGSGAGWFETNGTFTRALGSGSNQVAFSATNTSGLSARGGNLTVNFGGAGAGVTWGTGSFAGSALGLNSPTATGRLTLVNPISLNAGARTIQVDSGTAELTGIMSGASGSSLVKTGSGTLVLSGSNTFSGNVQSNGGYIVATNSNSLGSGVKSFTAQGTGRGLVLDGSDGGFTLGGDISYTLSNDNSGGLGPALRNVSGTNTIAGAITIQTGGGGLAVQSDAGLLTLAGTISNGASLRDLVLDGAGSGVVSSRISGGGNGLNLLKRGAGTWTLTGSNTLPGAQTSGTVSVNAGTLQIGDGGTNGSLNTVGVLTGSVGAMLAFNRSDAITFASGIDGGLGVAKLGIGTLTLTGSSTYSGVTTVNAGMLDFTTLSALRNTSGVTIAGGATLRYSGSAGVFDRPITVTAGSGTGTVRNSSGGVLTLSGNLSKDNSVLRLTGGAFNVTGTISGATSGASDLLVDGTSTVTLSAANTYNGPTFVNQASSLFLGTNNSIPSDSVVMLGDATSAGTLNMNGFTNAIGGLSFGAGGGTLRLAATGTSAATLASAGTVNLANGILDLAGSGTSAGFYRLISAPMVSGSFASVMNATAGYQLLTSSTTVNYQQRAVLGAVSVTNPASTIITGGSAAFTYTVANNALSGGADLGFASGSLSANLAGLSSGTALAGGASGSVSGLFFTGTSIGAGQAGTFGISAPGAFGSTTVTGTVAVTVLDHALPGFLATGIADPYTSGTLAIDFGSIDESAGVQSFTYNLLNLASQAYGSGLTAGLDFTGVTADGDGFASGLTTSFSNLVGGGTSSLYTFTFTPNGQGTFNRQFTLSFSDNQNLSGASARRDLAIVANVIVVPEPGTIAIGGIGIAAVVWAAHIRRKK